MALNGFEAKERGRSDVGTRAVAKTEHDVTELDPTPRYLWIGTAGDLVVDTIGGDVDVTFKNVEGLFTAVEVKRIKTASTCGDIVACW